MFIWHVAWFSDGGQASGVKELNLFPTDWIMISGQGLHKNVLSVAISSIITGIGCGIMVMVMLVIRESTKPICVCGDSMWACQQKLLLWVVNSFGTMLRKFPKCLPQFITTPSNRKLFSSKCVTGVRILKKVLQSVIFSMAIKVFL